MMGEDKTRDGYEKARMETLLLMDEMEGIHVNGKREDALSNYSRL